MKRRYRILMALLASLVLGLGILHLSYPLSYIFRVYVYQQPDYSDIYRFPASTIAAAESPSVLTVAPEPRVAGIFEQHPEIFAFDDFLEDSETTAFLVMHKGRIVEERYLFGDDVNTAQNTWSVAKSIMSALIGLAVRDGSLSLSAPITQYLPELAERDQRFGQIMVEHLINMRSGLRYSRDIDFPVFNEDDPLIYYYPDLESLVLERTEIAEPPGMFHYNNYNPPLLGLILRRTTGMSVSAYLEQQLWIPMGASRPAGWSVDKKGQERMESGFFATARDLARFGRLYLDHGVVGARRVLPEEWVRISTDTDERIEQEQYDGRRWAYRLGWWIVPRPEGIPDFSSIGRDGQFIYVSPQYDAVFVRNGPDRGQWGDRDWTALFYSVAEQL